MAWYALVLDTTPADAERLEAELSLFAVRGWETRHPQGGLTQFVVYLEIGGESAEERATAAERAARYVVDSLPRDLVAGARITEVDEKPWTENWRGHFPPLRAGRRLLVVPPWHELSDAERARAVVRINPAMAFGTGHHESTAGCLEILDGLVQPGDIVADVGTGSGILAIAAVRLGAAHAYATDDDPVAVNAANENIVMNNVVDRVSVETRSGAPELPPERTGFQILIANIYAETLVAMRPQITSCVIPGGHIVLAGIGSNRLPLVQDAYHGPDWITVRELRDGAWVALALQRSTG